MTTTNICSHSKTSSVLLCNRAWKLHIKSASRGPQILEAPWSVWVQWRGAYPCALDAHKSTKTNMRFKVASVFFFFARLFLSLLFWWFLILFFKHTFFPVFCNKFLFSNMFSKQLFGHCLEGASAWCGCLAFRRTAPGLHVYLGASSPRRGLPSRLRERESPWSLLENVGNYFLNRNLEGKTAFLRNQ